MSSMEIEEEEYKEAVRQLFFWQFSNEDPEQATNFTGMVFTLIGKAQNTPSSWAKLLRGFPHEVRAWLEWSKSGNNGHDLFAKYDLFPAKRKEEFQKGLGETYKQNQGISDKEKGNKWFEEQKRKKDEQKQGET